MKVMTRELLVAEWSRVYPADAAEKIADEVLELNELWPRREEMLKDATRVIGHNKITMTGVKDDPAVSDRQMINLVYGERSPFGGFVKHGINGTSAVTVFID